MCTPGCPSSGDGGLQINGNRVTQYYNTSMENPQHFLKKFEEYECGTKVGISMDSSNQVRLHLDGDEVGTVVVKSPPFSSDTPVHGLFDLYGQVWYHWHISVRFSLVKRPHHNSLIYDEWPLLSQQRVWPLPWEWAHQDIQGWIFWHRLCNFFPIILEIIQFFLIKLP